MPHACTHGSMVHKARCYAVRNATPRLWAHQKWPQWTSTRSFGRKSCWTVISTASKCICLKATTLVPRSSYITTESTTWGFVHTQLHFVVGSWSHDAVLFRETNDAMVVNFKYIWYLPSGLLLETSFSTDVCWIFTIWNEIKSNQHRTVLLYPMKSRTSMSNNTRTWTWSYKNMCRECVQPSGYYVKQKSVGCVHGVGNPKEVTDTVTLVLLIWLGRNRLYQYQSTIVCKPIIRHHATIIPRRQF